jgi:4,5-dihydroxyphthalate decarboxylase
MGKLSLSYAGHLSDRVRPLYDGSIIPEGINLHFIPLSPVQAFNRMLNGEFDCGEMSFSTYLIKAAQRDLSFIAIPVFPSRTFRHGAIYINRASGITEPKDLIGRRVGVPEYAMTAAVWARGALMNEYGVDPKKVHWVTGGLQSAGRRPLIPTKIPGVQIEHEEKRGLNDLLAEGGIDALIAPQTPPALRQGDERLAYLFPDVQAVERVYYQNTGIFPIMHAVVIRREVYERNPWIAVSLLEAFEKAKSRCIEDLRIDEPLPISLPWIVQYVNSIREIFGDDFWPYGVDKNRPTIEALSQYLFEQGLADRKVAIEELFPASLLAAQQIKL